MSWNLNGIRSAAKKGFLDWFLKNKYDVYCFQEVRAEWEQFPADVQKVFNRYANYWFPAQKKGYSGVGILSKKRPLNVFYGLGEEAFDCEGRVLTLEFDKFFVSSCYFPNSQDKGKRIEYKVDFCQKLQEFCAKKEKETGKYFVVCGDFNIAHEEIDLARPKSNTKNAGFLPEERSWMSEFLKAGWIDTFRYLFPEKTDVYSWWSFRTRARERNIGWRIDYFTVSKKGKRYIEKASVRDDVLGSDHCPVDLTLNTKWN